MGNFVRFAVAALAAALSTQSVVAQERPVELTPAGKAILQAMLAGDGRPLYDRPGPTKTIDFPLAMCTFPGGLCGAVRRDGGIAVPPRYDWVGKFADGRAAVHVGGLYGYVDEDGREVVKPQYRIVDDYKFGFAQVDVDGKSGIINRDGKMIIAPTYGFIEAVGPDRFRVFAERHLGGSPGSENFSGVTFTNTADGGVSASMIFYPRTGNVIDISGRLIEAPQDLSTPEFDSNDPAIRWQQRSKLWGLMRGEGTWLVEPKFELVNPLSNGLARVTFKGKVGFIDRTGAFVIEPVFEKAGSFRPNFDRTWVQRDGIVGVIDKTGAWVFQTGYQQIAFATKDDGRSTETIIGWHSKKADRWGLLNLDGRVVLNAEFDQFVSLCQDDRFVAYKDKEWFYFKKDGSSLQPAKGRLINAECGGGPPWILKVGNKFGLVDGDGRLLAPLDFDGIAKAGRETWNVSFMGKWGRIGHDGRWLLEPKFDYLSHGGEIFVASVDGKRGIMKSDGTWLIKPKFEAARVRDAETAFVTVAGATGVLHLADQSWAVAPRPGVMCDINNAIMSQSEGKRTILSRSGETWIDIGAERIGGGLDFGLLTFLKDGKWGLVDTAGQVVVEPRYDEPVYFSSDLRGVAWGKRGNQWCAIDRRGQSVPGIACADTNPTGGSGGRFECKVEQ